MAHWSCLKSVDQLCNRIINSIFYSCTNAKQTPCVFTWFVFGFSSAHPDLPSWGREHTAGCWRQPGVYSPWSSNTRHQVAEEPCAPRHQWEVGNEMNRASKGFEIRALAVWGRARYLSVTEAPHNTDFHTWVGKKHFLFLSNRRDREHRSVRGWLSTLWHTHLFSAHRPVSYP